MRGNKEVVIEGVCWACSVCDHMIATYTRARTDAERARARRGLVTCGQDCKVLSKHKGRYTDSLPVVSTHHSPSFSKYGFGKARRTRTFVSRFWRPVFFPLDYGFMAPLAGVKPALSG